MTRLMSSLVAAVADGQRVEHVVDDPVDEPVVLRRGRPATGTRRCRPRLRVVQPVGGAGHDDAVVLVELRLHRLARDVEGLGEQRLDHQRDDERRQHEQRQLEGRREAPLRAGVLRVAALGRFGVEPRRHGREPDPAGACRAR